jgi:hypothetical protein
MFLTAFWPGDVTGVIEAQHAALSTRLKAL